MWVGRLAPRLEGRIVTLEPLERRHVDGLRAAAAERIWTWMWTRDVEAWVARTLNADDKYLLLRHAFETLGCRRVEFKTDALNERARAALAAIPARLEGVHRKHMVVRDGERRDSARYAVVDDDWPEVKAALERRLEGKS